MKELDTSRLIPLRRISRSEAPRFMFDCCAELEEAANLGTVPQKPPVCDPKDLATPSCQLMLQRRPRVLAGCEGHQEALLMSPTDAKSSEDPCAHPHGPRQLRGPAVGSRRAVVSLIRALRLQGIDFSHVLGLWCPYLLPKA